MLWLNLVEYACLWQEKALSLLNNTMTSLETSGSGVWAAKECEIADGSLTARAGSIIGEHRHTHAIQEEGAIMVATEGLLWAGDLGSQCLIPCNWMR